MAREKHPEGDAEPFAAACWHLGVVFRDLTARESLSPPWGICWWRCGLRLGGSARRPIRIRYLRAVRQPEQWIFRG